MSQQDQAVVVTHVAFRLAKYAGEHVPGDGQVPAEFLVGGDGQATRRLTPLDPEFAAHLAAERAADAAEE